MEALWLQTVTKKRMVILFHAYTGSPADVRLLANFLHRNGYAVYVPVFRGHENGNVCEILKQNPQNWWQDAKDAVRKVKEAGYSTVAAFGLSMGGIMATGLVEKQLVEIAGTFCSPVSKRNAQMPELLTHFMTFAKRSLEKYGGSSSLEAIRSKAMAQMMAIQELSSLFFEQADTINGNFYIAQGGQDRLIDPNVSIELKEHLHQATVDFHWFEDSGHVITVGQDRQQFQQTVLEFLEKQEWR